MATEYYKGVNIRWGTYASSSNFDLKSVIMSVDVERKVDETEIKDGVGTTVSWIGYDKKKEATFEYVAADDTSPADGKADVTQPSPGDLIAVLSPEPNISGSKWLVKNVVEKAMNTDATKVTVRATEYPKIP